MLKSFKNNLAEKRLKSGAKPGNNSGGFNLNRLVLLLDESNEEVLKYFERLKLEFGLNDENFKTVYCGNFKEICDEALVFKLKQIAWNGSLKNDSLKSIITSNPDLVINYTEKENPEAGLLLKLIPAWVKAGRNNEKEINLNIKDGNRPEIFVEELITYIKILKTK